MKLMGNHNDTFNHGPDGHHMTSWGWDITEERLREILRTHSASRSVYDGAIYLRGPDYPGYQVREMPLELLDRLGVPQVNNGERAAG